MDHIVIRPAQPGDGTDLARGYLQSCRYYAQLDPEAFQVPATDGLTEWMEASLQRPRSQDNLWLVLRWMAASSATSRLAWSARLTTLHGRCSASWARFACGSTCWMWMSRAGVGV